MNLDSWKYFSRQKKDFSFAKIIHPSERCGMSICWLNQQSFYPWVERSFHYHDLSPVSENLPGHGNWTQSHRPHLTMTAQDLHIQLLQNCISVWGWAVKCWQGAPPIPCHNFARQIADRMTSWGSRVSCCTDDVMVWAARAAIKEEWTKWVFYKPHLSTQCETDISWGKLWSCQTNQRYFI